VVRDPVPNFELHHLAFTLPILESESSVCSVGVS
jgi:hypothetical protein